MSLPLKNSVDKQERLAQVYYRNATFSRESDGLRNLNGGVDWFAAIREQALEMGHIAIV